MVLYHVDNQPKTAMANLKAAMLAAQTLGELYALMEDYSYMEFMQIYKQLTSEQQGKLNAIEEYDNKAQMLAIKIAMEPKQVVVLV